MQEYKEIQQIMGTFQGITEDYGDNIGDFLADLFILEASEEAIAHYEEMLKITPEDGQTLEDRRYAIFLKYNETLPYTYKKLIEMITAICGNDFIINLSCETLTLKVLLFGEARKFTNLINASLEAITPVNVLLSLYSYESVEGSPYIGGLVRTKDVYNISFDESQQLPALNLQDREAEKINTALYIGGLTRTKDRLKISYN